MDMRMDMCMDVCVWTCVDMSMGQSITGAQHCYCFDHNHRTTHKSRKLTGTIDPQVRSND